MPAMACTWPLYMMFSLRTGSPQGLRSSVRVVSKCGPDRLMSYQYSHTSMRVILCMRRWWVSLKAPGAGPLQSAAGRALDLDLTPRGRAALNACHAVAREVEARLLADFTDQERD